MRCPRWLWSIALVGHGPLLDAQMTWSLANPPSRPSARYDHTMVYDAPRERVLLFGGDTLFAPILDDTWEWDGANWSQRAPSQRPSGRAGHGLACDLDRGVVVLFGGHTRNSVYFADTWEWDGSTWLQRTPVHAPPARAYLGLTYDAARRQSLLFGGNNGSTNLGDTWHWDGNDWTPRHPQQSPSPVSWHGLAYDTARRVVVLHGGPTIGTWQWAGVDWHQQPTSVMPPSSSSLCYDLLRQRTVLHVPMLWPAAQTWEFDGHDWRLLVGAGSPTTSRRDSTTTAYDVARGCVVAFGGWYFHAAWVFDDTWMYGPTTRSTITQVGIGCPGSTGVPWAVPIEPPIVGNRDFAVMVAPVPPGAPTWMAFSALPARRPVSGGCMLYVEPTLLSAPGVGSGSGIARVPVPLPAMPGLSGLVFHGQGVVVDPNGAWLGIAAFTQGLTIRIGD